MEKKYIWVIGCLLFLCFQFKIYSQSNIDKRKRNEILELSNNRRTAYVIITAEKTIPAEDYAAKELSEHFYKITGAKFPIISEKEKLFSSKGIYVGQTEFAASKGINFSELNEEEWIIKNYGKDLVLSGGRPRGTLYAVYEFLEQGIGCHWFDGYMEVIPDIPNLCIKEQDIHNKPIFWDRDIYTACPENENDFILRARNKDTRPKPAKFGFGYPLGTHTFYSYSRNFPEDKLEYHAMDSAGNRPKATSPSGPGQICLTNPDARENVLQQIEKSIEKNLKSTEKSTDGSRPQLVYFINPNDTPWICQCPDCKSLAEKEEADSGPYIDFINYIADSIKEKYPEVLIEGWAYANTMKPPKTIYPKDNVVIRIIQLKGEWAVDAIGKDNFSQWSPAWYPDIFRPRIHYANYRANEVLLGWEKISQHLAVWDYWRLYRQQFLSPYINLKSIYYDLQLFGCKKVGSMFAEDEICFDSFFWLKTWAGWKLMQNPYQDIDKLVKIFMDGYYGPAAEKMTSYLNYMEDSIDAVPQESGNMSSMRTFERPYLTFEFYKTCEHLLDEAEALCETGSPYLLNVQRERIPVDAGIIAMWHILGYQLPVGESMPWDKSFLIERYRKNCLNQIEQRHFHGNKESVENDIKKLIEISESYKGVFLRPLVSTGENNLLKNGNFSEGLNGWTYPESELVIVPEIDRLETCSGGACIVGRGIEGKQFLVSQQVEPVKGINKYRLSGWIKIKDFTNLWQAHIQATISLRNLDGKIVNKVVADCNTHHEINNMGWHFRGKEFEVPKDESIISISVTIFTEHPSGKGPKESRPNRGTVWFDEIVLEPVI